MIYSDISYTYNPFNDIIVITSCSNSKKSYPCKARELYTGQLFRMVNSLCNKFDFHLKILSAKYGLIGPDQVLKPYNFRIKYKKDIEKLQIRTKDSIEEIIKKYKKIIVIAGKNYREVLLPYFNDKFFIIINNKGIGKYFSQLKEFINMGRDNFLNCLEVYYRYEI